MGKININYTNGNLGGVLPSSDFISGLIFDSTVTPSGFSNGEVKSLFSIKDAENLGITDNHLGETKATGGKITIDTAAAANEVVTVYISADNQSTIAIGSYVVKTGDDASDIASGLNNSINLNSLGWTSTVLAGDVTLIAPSGLGESINGADIITCTSSNPNSDMDVTITNFTGGSGSELDVAHYIISTYFNANPTTKLWVLFKDFTSAFDADSIKTIQSAAGGEIRQLGIWTKKNLSDSTSIITACQTAAVDQASKYKPLSVILGFGNIGTATISNLANLRTLTSPRVSVSISNVYGVGNKGYELKGTNGVYPTDLGSVLGHVSRSSVANSIAWVQTNVTENANIMLITGEKWIDIEDTTRPDELAAKGYIFERKYFGYAGSYFDNDAVADSLISDYDSIKRMRTMDKVSRIGYFSLVPYLSSPIVLNASTGQLSQATIIKLTGVLNQSLQNMVNNSEISGFSVYIDPSQNVLSNKEIIIAITIVPIGSADQITLNLGYALSIA